MTTNSRALFLVQSVNFNSWKLSTQRLEKLYDYSSGIDLSCNILEDSIPGEIGLLKRLSMLNLSHNSLSGRIPKSAGNLTGLDSLDLRFNKLFGQMPESFALLDSLGYLNLSYSNLSGRIPRGLHLDTLSREGSATVCYVGSLQITFVRVIRVQ